MLAGLGGVARRSISRSSLTIANTVQGQASIARPPLLSVPRATLHHASAVNSPLVPKQHLKIPIPDDCQILQLPDGRLMSYGEYGSKAADAKPFIYVHGIPDCRFSSAMLPSDIQRAERLNIRWIGIDRPGMGLSTMHPGRTVTGWIDDLRHLIQHLNLKEYSLLGASGGTAYALAAAKLLPRKQLKSVGVMIGVAPWEAGLSGVSLLTRVGMMFYKHYPGAVGWFHKRWLLPIVQQESASATEAMLRKSKKSLQQATMPEDEIPGLARVFREAFRQGADGVTEDSTTATEDWGYDLQDVNYPGIRLMVWLSRSEHAAADGEVDG